MIEEPKANQSQERKQTDVKLKGTARAATTKKNTRIQNHSKHTKNNGYHSKLAEKQVLDLISQSQLRHAVQALFTDLSCIGIDSSAIPGISIFQGFAFPPK